jgi:hypothetical protein
MEAQAVVALVVGTVVVFFVPAAIWSALVAGLYQIARDKIRKSVRTVARKMAVALGTK